MVYFDRYALIAIFITFVYLLCCTVCWKYWKKRMPHRHGRMSSRGDSRDNQRRVQLEAICVAGNPNRVEHVKYLPSPPPPCYEDIELFTSPYTSLSDFVTVCDLPSYDDVMTTHAQTLTPSPNQTCLAADHAERNGQTNLNACN